MTTQSHPIKVVHISALDRGGAANGCIGLHLGLLAQGVDSTMLVAEQTRNDIDACYPLYDSHIRNLMVKAFNKLWGRQSYKLRGLPSGYEKYSFPRSSHRPERHSLVKSADIVNLHWVADFVNYPSFFASVSAPIVWTLHDMNPFSGGVHFAQGFPLQEYHHLTEANTELKRQALMEKNVTVVSPSRWLKNESAQSIPFGKFAHHVIPYAADIGVFKPSEKQQVRAKLGIETDKPVILFVAAGAGNKRKGLGLLVEALAQQTMQNRFTLVVVGKHSESLGLPAETITLGEVTDRETMASVYAAADIFTTPAIEDNLPNTVIESLCCGTPVVAFNIGGMPDMITHGLNGLLCDSIDSALLADTLVSATNTEFDESRISREAHLKYTPEVQATLYSELYAKLIENS